MIPASIIPPFFQRTNESQTENAEYYVQLMFSMANAQIPKECSFLLKLLYSA